MGTNYQRFLHIISKWPVDVKRKSVDYGHHLLQLVKNKDVSGNVFPGDMAENSKKLDSLLRLINNTYKNAYPYNPKVGATSDMEEKDREEILDNSIKMNADLQAKKAK